MSVRFCVSVAVVCTLVVCALAPAVLADESPAELKKIGEEKKNTLLSKSQSRPLIPLNSIDFRRLVGDGPRPYDLVVFLTSKSGGCSMCDEMRPELELVANAFEAARWEGGENEGPKHDLFFVELDGSRNYELFQQLGLQTVPHLVFVDRANNAKKKKWDRLLHDRMGLHRGWQADGIIKMLGSRSPVRVKFERPPAPVNWGFWVLVLTSATGFITFFSTVGHKYIDLYLRNKNIYLVVALLAYAFCTAGGMYNHIQGTPFNSMEADGSVQLINPQSGTQFGAETYIVGFLNLIMAFCLILLNTRVLEMKTPDHSRVLLILACVFAFHFFFFQLRHIYTRKNGGYRWGWVWSL